MFKTIQKILNELVDEFEDWAANFETDKDVRMRYEAIISPAFFEHFGLTAATARDMLVAEGVIHN